VRGEPVGEGAGVGAHACPAGRRGRAWGGAGAHAQRRVARSGVGWGCGWESAFSAAVGAVRCSCSGWSGSSGSFRLRAAWVERDGYVFFSVGRFASDAAVEFGLGGPVRRCGSPRREESVREAGGSGRVYRTCGERCAASLPAPFLSEEMPAPSLGTTFGSFSLCFLCCVVTRSVCRLLSGAVPAAPGLQQRPVRVSLFRRWLEERAYPLRMEGGWGVEER